MAIVQVLGLIFVGLVIGLISRLLLPGRQRLGLALTLVLGVGGAVIGGMAASAIGVGDVFELNFVGFIFAVLAAVGLLAVAQAAGIGTSDRDRVGRDRERDRLGR